MAQDSTPQEHPIIVPAPGAVLVAPSLVDDTEERLPSGLMISRAKPQQTCVHQEDPHRGVIMRIGERVIAEGVWGSLRVGSVVYYTQFLAMPFGLHVVPADFIAGWEDEA